MEESSESCDELAQLIAHANFLEKTDKKRQTKNNMVSDDKDEAYDSLSPFTKTYGSPKLVPDGLNYSDFDVPTDHLRILNMIEEWKEDYIPANASMSSTPQTFDKICHAFVDDMHESEEDICADELESFFDIPVQSDYLDSLEFSMPQSIDQSEAEHSLSPMDTASDVEIISTKTGQPLAESTQMTQSNHSQDNSLSCITSIRGHSSMKKPADEIESLQSVILLEPTNQITSQKLTKYVTIDLSDDLDHSQSLRKQQGTNKPSEENCSLQSSQHSPSLLSIKQVTNTVVNSRTNSTKNRGMLKTEVHSLSESEHHDNPHNISHNHNTRQTKRRKLKSSSYASKQDREIMECQQGNTAVACKVSDTPSSAECNSIKIALVSPDNKDIPTPVHSLTSYQQVNPDAADPSEHVDIQRKLLRIEVNLDWMKQYYQNLYKK